MIHHQNRTPQDNSIEDEKISSFSGDTTLIDNPEGRETDVGSINNIEALKFEERTSPRKSLI